MRWDGTPSVGSAGLIALNFVPCPRILWRSYFEGYKVGEFFVAHGLWLLSALPGAALCFVLCASLPNDLFGLVLRGVVCAGVYPLVWWLIWRRSERLADALAWLHNSGLLW